MTVALTLAIFGFGAAPVSASPNVPDIGLWSENTQGVRCVQNELNEATGADLAVDGIYGPKTRDAVKAYQRFFGIGGIKAEGVVNKPTGNMLWYTYDLRHGPNAWKAKGCWSAVPSSS